MGNTGTPAEASPSLPRPAGAEIARQIDRRVIQLFARVSDAIAGATDALLASDREAAQLLVERDVEIDDLYHDIDALAMSELMKGGVSPEELRYLIAVLQILPELERSGDLAEHVAQRAARGLAKEMSARARGLVGRMGEVASIMWRMVADAYGDRTDASGPMDRLDDEMDELHVTLTAELTASQMPIPVVVELTLIARFYERLGDHAVNLARRVPAPVAGPATAIAEATLLPPLRTAP